MKKTIKKAICCVIAVIMVFSCTATAFAKNDVTPVIEIHGMGAIELYKNPNTDEEEAVAGFDISKLLGENGLLAQLVSVARGENVNSDIIIDKLADFMSSYNEIALDENGDPINNIGIRDYWTDSLENHIDYLNSKNTNEPAICKQIADKIGAKNIFAFNYDWRLDACENADRLNTFIEGVKQQTKKDKVTIISGSEGTIVAAAYIDAYKNKNDIERVVFLNGAFNGVNFTKVLKKDLVFDKDIIHSYLEELCVSVNLNGKNLASLKKMVNILDEPLENLCKYLNEIVKNPDKLNKVYNEVLKPLGTIPALWEFIPYDDFDDCVKEMSTIGFLDKSSGLYTKITNYHNVQGRLENNLKQLKKNGVDIAVIANYGVPGIPVTSAYTNHCDILIDSELQSLGATFADYGSQIKAYGKYISDDNIIDASTGMFPENTWFIKGIQHMNFSYGTQATDFVATLTVTQDELNIESIKESTGTGQFINTDEGQNIVPFNDNEATVVKTEPKKSTSNSASIEKSPATGNNTGLVLLITLTGVAVIALLITSTIIKRKKCK